MLGEPIEALADRSSLVVGGHRAVVIGIRGRGPVRVRRDRSLVIVPSREGSLGRVRPSQVSGFGLAQEEGPEWPGGNEWSATPLGVRGFPGTHDARGGSTSAAPDRVA